MKRLATVIGFLLLLTVSNLSAAPVDTLVTKLSRAKSSEDRLPVLERLTAINMDRDFEKVLKYGEEGLAIARDLKQYSKMVAIGKMVIKANLELNRHLENASYFKEFDQLYEANKIVPDDYARIVYLESHFYDLLQDYASLQICTGKLIELQNTVSDNLKGKIKGFTFYFLSELAKHSKDYARAESFLLEKLKLNKEAADSAGIAAIYFDLATFQIEFGLDYAKAITYANQGLVVAKKLGWEYVISSLYIARFHALIMEKEFAAAKNQMDTVQQIIEQTDRSVLKAKALLNVGEYHFSKGAYKSALENYQSGLQQVESNRENPLIIEFYEALRQTYVKIGDYAQSYAYAEKEIQLSDSLFQEEKVQATTYYQTKLDLVQEESKNERLNNRLRRQNLFFLIISMAVLVAAFFIIQKIQTNRKLKALNNQIATDAEKLSSAYESLEYFSRSIYHDISSRVNLILSFSELKRDSLAKDSPSEFMEYVGFIQKNAAFIKQFIIDLRTFSKMGTSPSPPQEVDINRILVLILETLGTAIYEKEAVLSIADMPVITAHETPILQLFQNLIQNSIKYTRPGESPKVDIEHIETASHHYFHFENNGIPIPEKAAERIFQPFFRLKRKDTVGSGLGLAICKKIVDHYEGDIWLDQSNEKSTIFKVKLPKEIIYNPEGK